ncbi:hypothetical protein KSB_61010 [Ktedonobacter robiniae]|uniref:Uncharacterized protein n=1 Tax=Ktedonobacter robiniae TaxID=2778365 RepID=A0ABQ3UXQ2_9CHLR|nr:hypothetical protein KSB_61010 [Ktedonobacter robiniae]
MLLWIEAAICDTNGWPENCMDRAACDTSEEENPDKSNRYHQPNAKTFALTNSSSFADSDSIIHSDANTDTGTNSNTAPASAKTRTHTASTCTPSSTNRSKWQSPGYDFTPGEREVTMK